MSRPQDFLLKRLCRDPETLTNAQVVLHTARLKTGPGTGYDLRGASTALPAICAYIASEELRNGDVQHKMAQAASCLAPKEFTACLSIVRAALAASTSTPQTRIRSLSYEGLVVRFKYSRGEFMVSCMRDVEKVLIESGQLRGRFRPPNDVITIAVFCWTCAVLKLKKVQPPALTKEYGISSDDYQHIMEVIQTTCDLMEKDIKRRVSALRAERKANALKPEPTTSDTTPAVTPSKSVLSTPSKSALRSRTYDSSPTKTPTHKRKVTFSTIEEEDASALDTPTRKRPKLSDHPSPTHRTSRAHVLPALNLVSADEDEIPLPASSSKVRLDLYNATLYPTTDTEASTDVDAPLTPRSAPSTPRRPKRNAVDPTAPSDADQTPRKRKSSSKLNLRSTFANDDELVRPRRCRPILLSHKQWLQRDPRVEMEWRLAEAAKQSLLQKYGHPFEHLRRSQTPLEPAH